MRVLQGSKVVEAGPGWRDELLAGRRPLVIDLGAGDGRWAYESARRDALSLYIALDPDAEALGEYAFRAARKPARGGVENARFVVAGVEQIPPELGEMAQRVRVNFPWGSLLRGLLQPQPDVLAGLKGLLAPGDSFEVVLSYDPQHDTGAFAGEALPAPDMAYFADVLAPAYQAAGLLLQSYRPMTQDEALAIASTWGRRLLHARPRQVFWLEGRRVGE